MRRALCVFTLLVVVFTATSFSSEQRKTTYKRNELIGTWTLERVRFYDVNLKLISDIDIEENDPSCNSQKLIFDKYALVEEVYEKDEKGNCEKVIHNHIFSIESRGTVLHLIRCDLDTKDMKILELNHSKLLLLYQLPQTIELEGYEIMYADFRYQNEED